jgi:hypothetical protein
MLCKSFLFRAVTSPCSCKKKLEGTLDINYCGKNGVCQYACGAVAAVAALLNTLQMESVTYISHFKHDSGNERRCSMCAIFT